MTGGRERTKSCECWQHGLNIGHSSSASSVIIFIAAVTILVVVSVAIVPTFAGILIAVYHVSATDVALATIHKTTVIPVLSCELIDTKIAADKGRRDEFEIID